MANVCEVPELAGSVLFDGIHEELVEIAIELASAQGASRSVEMVTKRPSSCMSTIWKADVPSPRSHLATQSCISSIRVLGVLLSKRPPAVTPAQEQRAISTLCQRLKVSSPKIQWNAATAIKGYVADSSPPSPFERLLAGALLDVLKSDKNIKVRLSALTALREARSLQESGITLPEELAAAVESTEALKDSLTFDEAVRADQLISAVRELSDLIKSVEAVQPPLAIHLMHVHCPILLLHLRRYKPFRRAPLSHQDQPPKRSDRLMCSPALSCQRNCVTSIWRSAASTSRGCASVRQLRR